MKHLLPTTLLLAFALAACAITPKNTPKPQAATAAANPFLQDWTTPYGVPPFDKIMNDHFLPAFAEGMKRHLPRSTPS